MSWKEVRLSWQIVLFASKEIQEHSKLLLEASKGRKVIVSPAKALGLGSLKLYIWPSAPQAQKLNLVESISDLI